MNAPLSAASNKWRWASSDGGVGARGVKASRQTTMRRQQQQTESYRTKTQKLNVDKNKRRRGKDDSRYRGSKAGGLKREKGQSTRRRRRHLLQPTQTRRRRRGGLFPRALTFFLVPLWLMGCAFALGTQEWSNGVCANKRQDGVRSTQTIEATTVAHRAVYANARMSVEGRRYSHGQVLVARD